MSLMMRTATEADDVEVAELITAACQGFGFDHVEEPRTVAARREWCAVFVFEKSGRIVATCSLSKDPEIIGAVTLSDFVVHPSVQRQGIGEEACRELGAQLPMHGVTTVTGYAPHAMITAQRLYERLGARGTHTPRGISYQIDLTSRP